LVMSPRRRKKSPSAPSPAKEEMTSEGTVTETGAGAKEETAPKDPKEPEENIDEYGIDPKKDEKLRKYLLKLVDALFNPKYTKEMYPFKFRDMCRVLVLCKNIFYKEPVMIECRMPIVVVGDIHGQFSDLINVFSMFDEKERRDCFNQRFVFLGDYVDRGKQSVECIMIVFILKILFPGEYILLRGNHEIRKINFRYGFMDELKERFPDNSKLLFNYFNDVFNYMPLFCIAGNAILCMHGGICPEMTSREVFKGIPKPLFAVSAVGGPHVRRAEIPFQLDPRRGRALRRGAHRRGLRQSRREHDRQRPPYDDERLQVLPRHQAGHRVHRLPLLPGLAQPRCGHDGGHEGPHRLPCYRPRQGWR
ncbi:hypothetical protein PENTCL1PPCAC_25707, partial [Pristionchus entomophagus]